MIARAAFNTVLALAVSLGLSTVGASEAHAKKKHQKGRETASETTSETTTTHHHRKPSSVEEEKGATFHCLGIGTGHHFKGMTEQQCRDRGGTVTH